MELLDQPSIVLERLDLEVYISNVGMTDVKGMSMENEPKTCTTLRELVLRQCYDSTGSEGFWSSLFRRCGRLKKVQVFKCIGIGHRLAQDMLVYMPHLDEICLGEGDGVADNPNDAAPLWITHAMVEGREVAVEFGTETIDALSKHTSTLEMLDIYLEQTSRPSAQFVHQSTYHSIHGL
jgi:hypothetical protein